MGKNSQCSCCGELFLVISEEVLYCSDERKENHSIFKICESEVKRVC